jgi:hypothetical protein
MGHRDHHHAQLSTAEVLTVAVIAAKYFQNHHERTVAVLALTGYIRPISRSRFNRRLHQAGEWLALILDYWSSQRLEAHDYVVDTMPLPVCHKSRAEQCRKIPQVKGYIGRCAAKNEWFCGWRLHWVCDAAGFPIAFDLVPAVWHELTTLQNLIAGLPPGATVYGDGAYLSFDHQALALLGDIQLVVETHPRLHQQNTPLQRRLLKKHRSRIESQHSVLEKMGVQRLHAVTAVGFGLKVYASLLALAVNLLVT